MSIYADQGTAAHKALEELLQAIYHVGTPMRASVYDGATITLSASRPGDHARLSPSGAKGWMTCAKRPLMAELYPEPPEPERSVTLTEDDTQAIQTCLDYVATRVAWITEHYGPVEVLTERRVSTERLTGTKENDGTSDITLRAVAAGYAEHIDYKHGRGVAVTADDPQNAVYFLGTCAELAVWFEGHEWCVPFRKARLTVCQPRCDKIEPRIRWVEIDDVNAWVNPFRHELVNAIAETKNPDAPFNPSKDACRWCPVGGDAENTGAPLCEAYVQYSLGQMGIVMEQDTPGDRIYAQGADLASRDIYVLNEDQLVSLLDIAEMLKGVLSAAETHGLSLFERGQAGPLLSAKYKPVRGRSNRRWTDVTEKEWNKRIAQLKFFDPEKGKDRALLKSERYVQKKDSPAGIEAKLKKFMAPKIVMEAFKTLYEKPPGKLTLAPASDPRDSEYPDQLPLNEALDKIPDELL